MRFLTAAIVSSSLGLTSGCSGYQAGSFHYVTAAFAGVRATIGCLDVAVAREPDLEGAAVLAYSFGNGCDGPETIDLGAVVVRGRTASGAEITLAPEDPDGEIRPLPVDGHLVGRESLAYGSAYASAEPLVQICVDLASIGHGSPPSWHCFGSMRPPTPGATSSTSIATAEVTP